MRGRMALDIVKGAEWIAGMPSENSHPKDPLHGVTLEAIVTALQERHGWEAMGERVPVRCFLHDPSVKSSLTFLRKTPWARKRVEDWYVAEALRARANREE